MTIASIPIHNLARVAASAAVKAVPTTVWAVMLVGGSTASTLKLTNDADGSGTAVLYFVAPFTDTDASAADTKFFDFTPLGGVAFSSKLYATIAGTSAECYIWYD